MKYRDSGHYWTSLFAVSAVVLLCLSAFWSYRLWTYTKEDAANLRAVSELKEKNRTISFLSQRAVTINDSVSSQDLGAVVESMGDGFEYLQSADDFTRLQLTDQYQSIDQSWRIVQSNVVVITEIEGSVGFIRGIALELDTASKRAQRDAVVAIEELVWAGGSSEQVRALNLQAILLREMEDSLTRFANQSGPSSQFFDEFREKLAAFEKTHSALLEGDAVQKIEPLAEQKVRDAVIGVYGLLQNVRSQMPTIVNTVDDILRGRNAHAKIEGGVTVLQSTLGDFGEGLGALEQQRVIQPLYILVGLVGFVLCVIGFFISQRYSSREMIVMEQSENENVQAAILQLLDELSDLADGDLTVTTTISEDFTGAIADSINYTINQLRQLVARINTTAKRVSGAAQESQQTALHLAEASDLQAQEIAGASAAINEMAVTIDQVSANAAESALVASKSVSIANNGAELVQNTIQGMDSIREQIQDTAKRIKRLGESSQEIGDIISLINEIADQTNILALNAAIQASMAGDAGRGFAVVADEVQRLAERSSGATKQIESLVKGIQKDTYEAVMSMEQTTSEVVGGARLAQDAGVALEEIERVSANIADLIQNISNAARQQASSAGHISDTMNVIQDITSQTSAGTGATAHAIGDLADMALELRESVAGFKLPDDLIEVEAESSRKQLESSSVDETTALAIDDAWTEDEFSYDDSNLQELEAESLADIDNFDDLFNEEDIDTTELTEFGASEASVANPENLEQSDELVETTSALEEMEYVLDEAESFEGLDLSEQATADLDSVLDELFEVDDNEFDLDDIAVTEDVDVEEEDLFDGVISVDDALIESDTESLAIGDEVNFGNEDSLQIDDEAIDFSEELISLAESEEMDRLDDEIDLSNIELLDGDIVELEEEVEITR